MQEYTDYNVRIESLIQAHLVELQPTIGTLKETQVALDGGAAEALRERVSIDKLRQFGAFFTGSQLAERAIESIVNTLSSDSIILDSACGAGDLLIACAKHLQLGSNVEETLCQWGQQILAHDISDEFVRTTKLRLILSALNRERFQSKHNAPIDIESSFPLITRADGLTDLDFIRLATHIVINPPFVRVVAPEWCDWSNARVNSAALFLEQCVLHAREGTRVVAILPDVLRSGTNYVKWRKKIEERAIQHRLFLHGQFDKYADVDVFVVDLEITDDPAKLKGISWRNHSSTGRKLPKVADKFNVHCGRVVEYRDPHQGETFHYITPKTLPAWEVVNDINTFRQFEGKVYKSPFVAVRRTSRKGHAFRAVGTIVNTGGMVAVENHLIVLLPKSGRLEDCQKLLKRLKSEKTNGWLNETIRCRHLTVSSLQELPWWGDDEYS